MKPGQTSPGSGICVRRRGLPVGVRRLSSETNDWSVPEVKHCGERFHRDALLTRWIEKMRLRDRCHDGGVASFHGDKLADLRSIVSNVILVDAQAPEPVGQRGWNPRSNFHQAH